MKNKLIAVALLIFVSPLLHAQKGTTTLYGNFGFLSTDRTVDVGYNRTEELPVHYVNFSPGIGFGFGKGGMAGINLGIENKSEDLGYTNVDNTTYLAGIFLRYTQTFNDYFSFYLQGNISYIGGIVDEVSYSSYYSGRYDTYDLNGFDFTINPTMSVSIGKRWAMNMGFGALGYSALVKTPQDDGEKVTESTVGFLVNGNTLRWGVSLRLNSAK